MCVVRLQSVLAFCVTTTLLPCLIAQDSCESEDVDGDGWTVSDGDCNDTDPTIHPGAELGCDNQDHDCDGSVDNDADGDGFSDVACGGSDCNDSNPDSLSCNSCSGLLASNPELEDGIYVLDPCGDGNARAFYCDMTREGGGWTVAGWQEADATTNMGIEDRGEVGTTPWSSNLECLSYSEIMVFNRTYDLAYTQTYTPAIWDFTETNMTIGEAGTAFKQGTYGPSTSLIMMGCVDYSYNGSTYNEYACDTDSQANQKGHIADYAGEYCSGGRLDGTWAWTDGSSCFYRSEMYEWGFAIR